MNSMAHEVLLIYIFEHIARFQGSKIKLQVGVSNQGYTFQTYHSFEEVC